LFVALASASGYIASCSAYQLIASLLMALKRRHRLISLLGSGCCERIGETNDVAHCLSSLSRQIDFGFIQMGHWYFLKRPGGFLFADHA